MNEVKLVIRLKLPHLSRILPVQHMHRFASFRRGLRAAAVLGVGATAALAAACGDPLGLQSRVAIVDQPFTVFAISDADLSAPTGMDFSTRTVVRADGQFAFDVAFDIDSLDRPVILPVGQVGSPLNGAPLVGILRSKLPYDQVTSAPTSGYVFDSTATVRFGETVVIQAQVSSCIGSYTPYIFVKMRVDSVNVAEHAIRGRTLININCGSRQLTAGVPTF